MFCGDDVLYNDEQRARIEEASRKAAQGWRFMHLKRSGIRALNAVLRELLDVARRGIDALRHKIQGAHSRRPLTLTEQR
jgi:hypothetical protein